MAEHSQTAAELEPEAIEAVEADDEVQGMREISATELKGITESLIFVADEPIDSKSIAKVLRVDQSAVDEAVQSLVEDYAERSGGLHLREIAGGWQTIRQRGRVDPHLLRNFRILRRYQVREHQRLDSGSMCDASGVFCRRMVRQDTPLEVRCIRHTRHETIDGGRVKRVVHEDVRTPSKLDQVVRWPGVTGNDDRPILRVESISERRNDRRVIHQSRSDPDILVLEHDAALPQLVDVNERLQRYASLILDPRGDIV